jgi:hypothetical protein
MSDCCSSSSCKSTPQKKRLCPRHGANGTLVSITTIQHHLKQPWHWQASDQAYYFCDDPHCEVAYFAEDDSIIKQSELRTEIGIKTQQPDALICYCYGVSLQAAQENPAIKAFVVKMTKQSQCACETRNPSGRCCLKDFRQ